MKHSSEDSKMAHGIPLEKRVLGGHVLFLSPSDFSPTANAKKNVLKIIFFFGFHLLLFLVLKLIFFLIEFQL